MTHYSACPHDCPSTALEVEKLDDNTIGKVRGASEQTYTAGVICSKVARYSERIHHPDRLTQPLKRTGEKGSGQFSPISWEDALDEVAERLLEAEQRDGSEAVWPYQYAGTMGLVMRDGINRLRHVKKYSGFHSTICVNMAWNGFWPEPDASLAWTHGNGQVGSRHHLGHQRRKYPDQCHDPCAEARRERGAKIVVIDTHSNATAKQADLFLCVQPEPTARSPAR